MAPRPSFAELRGASSAEELLPLWDEIPADLETPVSAYLKLAGQGASFLLESVEGGGKVGRYSFIGLGELARFELAGRRVTLQRGGAGGAIETREVQPGQDPLAWVQELCGRAVARRPGRAVPPFLGGMVGFLGYDIVRHFERLPAPPEKGPALPDAALVMPRAVVAFDHVQHMARVVTLVDPRLGEEGYRRSCAELDAVREALRQPLPPLPPVRPSQALAGPDPGGFSREGYCQAVVQAKEHILAGDIFQVVLSQRDVLETQVHPFEIYRALRRLNPSPYNFYLDLGEVQLIGSSPEALFKLDGSRAILRPIAGTRRRAMLPDGSFDDVLEARLAEELLADEKERAEHVMLVDLARNDLGRVCQPASVTVDQLMALERYSHVMHLVSTVSGELRPEVTAFDLVRAAFPAGTVSGAPKIRAMEIIDALESSRRGPYAGAVGYFGPAPGRQADFCITIRTLVAAGGRVALQAGAGIVADSDPDREHEETVAKVGALRRAVQMAEEASGRPTGDRADDRGRP